MDEIRLKDYRCFREEQTARLAPLTLLVGENSTGKTSFLALLRVLWDLAIGLRLPDFKEEPYDLGSFDDIAHYRGGKGGRAETFEGEIGATRPNFLSSEREQVFRRVGMTFGKDGITPVPLRRSFECGEVRVEERFGGNVPYVLRVSNKRGSWEKTRDVDIREHSALHNRLAPPLLHFPELSPEGDPLTYPDFIPLHGSPAFGPDDLQLLQNLPWLELTNLDIRPFASAPVRSKPRRTYDPSRPIRDSEGDYVPMYFADVLSQRGEEWAELKKQLEKYGRAAGLFDEISIKRLGHRDSEPFQIQVRKLGKKLKGPLRNLIDVGYGVSQVLPVITELLRPDAPPLFLLQQPEVHLHPSAQAALGSLFCQIANRERQVIVETHSDHLLDRVRMDVRDGRAALKPEDVSILFFERNELDVHIHSLRIDGEGNVLNAPDSYRRFFMEETARSLGL